VQSEAIPILFSSRDLICCAPTGSGKTAAFVLPLLGRLENVHQEGGPRGLIVAPTRELALQVNEVVQKLCEGTNLTSTLLSSERSAKPHKWKNNGIFEINIENFFLFFSNQTIGSWDIVVATPMRLLKLVEDKLLSLETVQYLVLDEADRLFESDFVEQADAVFSSCTNPDLNKAMFSATIGERPERLAKAIMFSPVRIIIGGRVATLSNDLIQQELVFVGKESGKIFHFREMLAKGLEPPVLIFMQNRERAGSFFFFFFFFLNFFFLCSRAFSAAIV
jgi:ATP-dependent RNA helicase DDX52/ROK1